MVRLRRVVSFIVDAVDLVFQSHYGAIATRLAVNHVGVIPNFNPTMVRLRLWGD